MTTRKKRWWILPLAVGAAGIVGLVASVVAAKEKTVPDDEKDDAKNDEKDDAKRKGEKYQGPGPGLPKERVEPLPAEEVPETMPEAIAEDDLWIAPDCSSFVAGSKWEENTARPALRAWIADGYVDRNQFHHYTVVRGLLGPYSPLCVDVFPWADVAQARGVSADQFNEILRAKQAEYPDMAYLIGRVHALYKEELAASPEAPEAMPSLYAEPSGSEV